MQAIVEDEGALGVVLVLAIYIHSFSLDVVRSNLPSIIPGKKTTLLEASILQCAST